MKREEFNKMVSHEIIHLTTYATDEEKKKLNFKSFDYKNESQCIYGQMTGCCHSLRAFNLMPKKYKRISNNEYNSFSYQSFKKGTYYTHLEKYLFMVDSIKHEEIINFIKGFSQTLLID